MAKSLPRKPSHTLTAGPSGPTLQWAGAKRGYSKMGGRHVQEGTQHRTRNGNGQRPVKIHIAIIRVRIGPRSGQPQHPSPTPALQKTRSGRGTAKRQRNSQPDAVSLEEPLAHALMEPPPSSYGVQQTFWLQWWALRKCICTRSRTIVSKI